MAEIRLNKIIRTYNIGLQNLVDFLISKGVEVEANPNAKISDDLLPQIEKQFGKDLELKQASEKVDIKLNEILEKTSRKQQENAKEEEDEEPVRETVIKTTIFTPVEQRQEAAQAPQPEVAPEPRMTHCRSGRRLRHRSLRPGLRRRLLPRRRSRKSVRSRSL